MPLIPLAMPLNPCTKRDSAPDTGAAPSPQIQTQNYSPDGILSFSLVIVLLQQLKKAIFSPGMSKLPRPSCSRKSIASRPSTVRPSMGRPSTSRQSTSRQSTSRQSSKPLFNSLLHMVFQHSNSAIFKIHIHLPHKLLRSVKQNYALFQYMQADHQQLAQTLLRLMQRRM